MSSQPPVVFVSYSYDSQQHQDWVLKLATKLRDAGVDIVLDQWELKPGANLTKFMEGSVARSDRVLVICSSNYVAKADGERGGVGFEKLMISAEIFANTGTEKFVPVLRNNPEKRLPRSFGARLYVDFDQDEFFEQKCEELLRAIHGAAKNPKPPIGPNPFAAGHPTGTATTAPPPDIWSDVWVQARRSEATPKVMKVAPGIMEVAFAPVGWVPKIDRQTLKKAASAAQISTSGWPIGMVVERAGFSPQPALWGLVTEVGAAGLYDFWAAANNGSFYLARTLFEDKFGENLSVGPYLVHAASRKLAVDTRIKQVAEALLFCRRFYNALGCPPDTSVALGIKHQGLMGRVLAFADPGRFWHPRSSSTEEAEAVVAFSHPLTDLRKSGHRGHLNRVIVDTKIAMVDSDIGMVDSDIGHRGQWV